MTARVGLYSVGGLSIPLQELISLVGVDQENAPFLSVCQYDLLGLDTACLLGVCGLS